MAGFLPNVPGVRIPYHRDGSLVKTVTTTGATAYTPSSTWSTVPSGEVLEMNDGDQSGRTLYSFWNPAGNNASGTGAIIAIVFPQLVTIKGHNLMITYAQATASHIYYSADTVDGTDGTWTLEASNMSTSTVPIEWRNITGTNILNVKGIRIGAYLNDGSSNTTITTSIKDFQLYGQWSPATLSAWSPTLDQQIDGHELDFGDVLLGNVYNRQFRIKNGHTLTANNVVVSCTTGTAEFISGLSLSLDGTNFSSSVTIPTISPGAISGTIYVRRTVSAGQSANIVAMAPIDFVATTWT